MDIVHPVTVALEICNSVIRRRNSVFSVFDDYKAGVSIISKN